MLDIVTHVHLHQYPLVLQVNDLYVVLNDHTDILTIVQ